MGCNQNNFFAVDLQAAGGILLRYSNWFCKGISSKLSSGLFLQFGDFICRVVLQLNVMIYYLYCLALSKMSYKDYG